MKMPIFPQDFIEKRCPKVREARYWREYYNPKGFVPDDDLTHAECAFAPAGFSVKCENCGVFLHNQQDDDYRDRIKKYYEDMAEYEKYCNEQEKHVINLGEGI
jgi:glutathione S-transferase